jgi:hypothetical protein
MPLNWSKLAPHRPLKPDDPLHVRRPDGGGEELAEWIKAGAETVAIAGPVGSGKSTELAWAASCLQGGFVVIQVPLDRLLDMRHVTEEEAVVHVVKRVVHVARNELGLVLSDALLQRVAQPYGVQGLADRDLLRSALREVAAKSRQGAIVLLLDGLEKCEAEIAVRVVRPLLDVRDESRVVFVVPYSVVVGRHAHELQANVDRWFFIRAVSVRPNQGQRSHEGRQFLREIVRVRLDLRTLRPTQELAPLLDRAAEASGGVPRSFLQIVRAAASYAAMDDRELLTLDDLEAAMHDHAESMERLLVEGDIGHLLAADGKSGVAIPEERRLRLLMQGLLLEYKTDTGTVVHPAPLLVRALSRGAGA